MSPKLSVISSALLACSGVLCAEDWRTLDNAVYKDVAVIKLEPDAVTIIYHDGGALIPLVKLPPDLQKRFNYDPLRAQAAADARAKADNASARALKVEKSEVSELQKKMKAKQEAELRAAAEEVRNLKNFYAGANAGSELMNPNYFAGGDVWGHLKSDPIPHYRISDILQSNSRNESGAKPAEPAVAGVTAKTGRQDQTVTASADMAGDLAAHKIRLIGKVESIVAGGYILGSVSGEDHHTIQNDPSRPNYELLSERTNRGTVFLYSLNSAHVENEIVDVDVYPMSTYTALSGETMQAFTTSASLGEACLKPKRNN